MLCIGISLQYHPDKNPSPEAETMFKEVGYVELPNTRLLAC